MKRYLPVLVLIILVAAGCWSAGCMSASDTTRSPAQATGTPGPEMTTQPSGPVAPVFTVPAFGGVAEEGSLAAAEQDPANSSRYASERDRTVCPPGRQVRCTDGECAVSPELCPKV